MHSIDFTPAEHKELLACTRRLMRLMRPVSQPGDTAALRHVLHTHAGALHRDRFGLHPVIRHMHTAVLLAERLSPDRNMVLALMLYEYVRARCWTAIACVWRGTTMWPTWSTDC